jgi:hypothetical protein
LGVCNGTAGTDVPTIPAASTVTTSGWNTSPDFLSASYARVDGDSSAPADANQIEISRTNAASEGSKSNLQLSFTGLTHLATANKTFYPRIRLYNDPTAGSLVWEGAVAQSTSQTLTVNARVQEILQFCVGATGTDNATSMPQNGTPANINDCSNMTGTDVDLGVVDSGAISTTPVALAAGGDNENGIAMVRTNAVNGVVIDYKAVQETSSGKLKVATAACSGVSVTDQCFNSQGTSQGTFTAGTENFGMTVAGVNCGSVNPVSYTCVYATGNSNVKPDAAYQGQGTFGSSYVYGTANGFAWDDSGAADRIASSAGSAVKVVDDEALMLKFAATAGITTPTGQYTVQADFIATPTF